MININILKDIFANISHLTSRSIGLLAVLFAPLAQAGEADVIDASADCHERVCTFTVTVRHADAGWQHYADHWRILTPDGTEIARRVLLHPHDDEQPFTRSLSGVVIPAGVTRVVIEAHDNVHQYGGQQVELDLD